MQQTTANYFIGIDIGGTKCAIVIGDREFNIFKKIQFETKTERGYKAILNDFFDNLDKLFNEFPKKQIQQIANYYADIIIGGILK